MKSIEQKIIKFIAEKNLIENGDKILIALSGGPDSVFLLHFLVRYKKKYNIELSAIHINHMIRGKDALADKEFCRKLSLNLGLKFYSFNRNVKNFAKKNNISIEESGRILRYKDFNNTLKKIGYDKIATAHNCSDNAETVLLNLIKGTGIRGISGIPVKRENIIRPILNLTKEEIIDYLNFYKLEYRIDHTNFSSDYERSYLRNNVIPLIKKKLNPNLENTIFNSSEIFKDIALFLDDKIFKKINKLFEFRNKELLIPVSKFKEINDGLRGYLLKTILEEKFHIQTSYNDFKKIESLLDKNVGKKVDLSQNLKAFRERDYIIVFFKKVIENFEPVLLKDGDSLKIKGKTLTIKSGKYVSNIYSESKKREYVSANKVIGDFVLRKWKNGEKFFPLGLKGSKKISDFLNEQKISSSKKNEQLVLTNQEQIVWVLGLRLDDRFKVTNNTEKVIELCLM
jgi:tRNA(Ile)-lysidine synthase